MPLPSVGKAHRSIWRWGVLWCSCHNQEWLFGPGRVLTLFCNTHRAGTLLDMSVTLITIVVAGVVVSAASILRWQRDFVVVRICPREILFLETVEERYRVQGRGLDAFLRHRSTWKAFIVYAVALVVPSALGFAGLMTMPVTPVGPWSATGVKLAGILCAVIPPFFLIPLMFARYRRWMRVYLREYLNDHGIPICRNCGYDLRGQVNPRCPECGMEFDGEHEPDRADR